MEHDDTSNATDGTLSNEDLQRIKVLKVILNHNITLELYEVKNRDLSNSHINFFLTCENR